MKKIVYVAIGLTWMLNSCSPCIKGSDNIVTIDRPTSEFHGIHANGSYEVIISQGEGYAVKVTANDNVLPYILTDVRGGTLYVESRSIKCFKREQVKVYLTSPRIDKVSLNGSGNVYTTNTLVTDELTVDLNGSGNLNIANNSSSTKANLKGSGNLRLSGSCEKETLLLSGSGNIEANNYTANEVVAKLTGSGNIDLFAKTTLKATLTGSGRIRYSGNPSTDINITGSGKVTRQ